MRHQFYPTAFATFLFLGAWAAQLLHSTAIVFSSQVLPFIKVNKKSTLSDLTGSWGCAEISSGSGALPVFGLSNDSSYGLPCDFFCSGEMSSSSTSSFSTFSG